MKSIKCVSERTKKDMEQLANAGVDDLPAAQLVKEAKKREAKERRVKSIQKSEKQDTQKNYGKHFHDFFIMFYKSIVFSLDLYKLSRIYYSFS